MKFIRNIRPQKEFLLQRAAFTLIELLITIVVVGIISIPLSVSLFQQVEGTFRSQDYTMAINLARYEMEIVNNMDWDNILSANYLNYLGTSYNLARRVRMITPPGVEGLKQVSIQVRRAGSADDLAIFITYIARNARYGI
ncbi:MAG: prepilin-type N-terminal cleavage/methylation domain-containing protein [Candidatus Omnitrophota bacterium]